MTPVQQAIALSAGKWVSVDVLEEHLASRTASSKALGNMATMRGVFCECQITREGKLARYRAFETANKSPIQLAKERKAKGILFGMESINFGGKGL